MSMRSNIFDKIAFVSLFLVIILLPVFFLPFTTIPVETSKGLLLVAGLAVCVISWCLARFFDGKITLPRSASLLTAGGVVLAFFLSAVFSQAKEVSMFGTMFDVGSFWFVFTGFLLLLMSAIILRNHKHAKIVLLGVILSSVVVLVFQTARLFIPALSLGIFADRTGNLIGSWNAFGIFAGFSTLMSLLVVEFFSTTKVEKLVLHILTIFGIAMVAVVNFALVWELVGISSLIIFVYKISIVSHEIEGGEKKTPFPTFSFIVILITLMFFMSGQFIGGVLPARLGITNNEVSPSLSATTSVASMVLKTSPVFGIGPNKFAEAWAMYKPSVINGTAFWDVSFNSGSGLLPTFAVTTGGLGIFAWVVFFLLFIVSGIKSVFSSVKHGSNWETMAFFVLSFYLFISAFFYSTGAVLFLLALAFAGIFIGLATAGKGDMKDISISYLSDHRKSFFSILFIVIIIIATTATSFKFVERLISVSYFSHTLSATEISVAEDSIAKSLALYQNDLYLRTYAQVYLAKLNSLVKKGGDSMSDEDKAALQASLDQAVNGAQLAAKYNPNSYLNFQALGSIYQALASVGVKDAYTKAVDAYKTASALNPNNPGIKLSLASASFANKDVSGAKDYANQAITLKADYVDGYVILAQIEKSEGDTDDAVAFAEKALTFAPNNKDLIKFVDAIKGSSQSVTPPASISSTPTPTPAFVPPATPKKTKK